MEFRANRGATGATAVLFGGVAVLFAWLAVDFWKEREGEAVHLRAPRRMGSVFCGLMTAVLGFHGLGRNLPVLLLGGRVFMDEDGIAVDLPGRRGWMNWQDVKAMQRKVDPGGYGRRGTHSWCLQFDLKPSRGRINSGLWVLYAPRHDLTLRDSEIVDFEAFEKAAWEFHKQAEKVGNKPGSA